MPTTIDPSGNQDIDGILWGWKWISTELTYSFPTDTSTYGSYVAVNGFESFNANQQTAAERALANVASFTNLTFTESTGDTTLRFAEADSIDRSFGVQTITTAKGTPPDPNFAPSYAHGDMWFNHTNYNNPALGSFAYACGVMHELGHALGLKHGHIEQEAEHDDHEHDLPALPADHDSLEYTVMTYRSYPGAAIPDGNTIIANDFPQTFMMNDISTLQYLYGANYSYNSGNTTYSWSQTTGEMSIDGVAQGAPTENEILLTIWDGGGNDTYDFSNYTSDLVVSLVPGEWSTTSASQLADLGGEDARGNIANARLFEGNINSLIENAYGGTGNDTITGNQAANALKGGGGADTLAGLEGVDLLVGEAGDDNLKGGGGADNLYGGEDDDSLKGGGGADYLNGGSGVDTVDYSDSDAAVIVNLAAGTGSGGAAEGDTLLSVENVIGSAEVDWLFGDGNLNKLEGRNGDDLLKGGGGADALNGGNGIDTASYYDSVAGVTVSLYSGTGTGGEAQGDTLVAIENLTGSGHADTLIGNDGANNLSGSSGDDTLMGGGGADDLSGGSGNDLLKGGGGADALDGGSGIDTATYIASTAGVVVSLISDTASGGEAAGDELDSIENLIGSSHGDTLVGDNNVNKLEGLAGNDTLKGYGGTDSLEGGEGIDALYGMDGGDTLLGGNGNDTLVGGASADTLNGGAGTDTATFFGGRATYDVRTYLNGSTLTTLVAGGDGTDTATGVEKLQFTSYTAQLAGAQLNRTSSVDGDRFDDVLFQDASSGEVLYARMVNGAFHSWGAATGVLGSGWEAVASGDVNPSATSGGAETFVQEASTGSILYASQDTGATTWGVVSNSLTSAWKLRAAGDINGDASTDVIVQDLATGSILYADMKSGAFQSWGVVNDSLNADWVAIGAGDINRDGFADVVVQQQSTGTTVYADMANGTFGGWEVVSNSLSTAWKAAGVADLTGDGFAEVIFQNTPGGDGVNPGTTYYADLQTGTTMWGVVTTNVDATWETAGAADVDNDGFSDVLFQNTENGATLYADMNAGAFAGWGVVNQDITSEWQLV